MLIRYDHRPSPEQLTLKLAVQDMREGVGYLRGKPAILVLLGAILFINFFCTPVTSNFVPYFVKTDVAGAKTYLLDRILTPELWSSVFSVCVGISSLLGAAILSARPQEDKCGQKVALRLLVMGVVMILVTISYGVLAGRGVSLNGFLIAFSLASLAFGFLTTYINIPISTSLMRVVDRDKLSKVSSILSIGCQGMIPLATILAGLVLSTLGSTALLSVCALGFTVTAILLLTSKRIQEI